MTDFDLAAITLKPHQHDTREDGVCVMEALAWYTGQEHTDRPQRVNKVVADFSRGINDMMPTDERNRILKPYIAKLVDCDQRTTDEEAAKWIVEVIRRLTRECVQAFSGDKVGDHTRHMLDEMVYTILPRTERHLSETWYSFIASDALNFCATYENICNSWSPVIHILDHFSGG